MLKKRVAKLWAKAMKKYRLVLYDHESLSQSRNIMLRPLGVFLLLTGIGLATIAGTTFVIFKTPAIRKHIPGYKTHLTDDYKKLQEKNQMLEKRVAELGTMIETFGNAVGMDGHVHDAPEIWEQEEPEADGNQPRDSAKSGQSPNEIQPPVQDRIPNQVVLERRPPEILNLVPPVDGYVTMGFETKSIEDAHFGIDLVADENSMIRAVEDGVVIFSEYSNTTGYVIGIWHGEHDLISFYKHNSRLFKPVGSYVFAGEAIAVIGNTGINSSGTHLHFELWYDNNPVDPADYILFN